MSRQHPLALRFSSLLSFLATLMLAAAFVGCTPPPTGKPPGVNTTTTGSKDVAAAANQTIGVRDIQSNTTMPKVVGTKPVEVEAEKNPGKGEVTPPQSSDSLSPIPTDAETEDKPVAGVMTETTPPKDTDSINQELVKDLEEQPEPAKDMPVPGTATDEKPKGEQEQPADKTADKPKTEMKEASVVDAPQADSTAEEKSADKPQKESKEKPEDKPADKPKDSTQAEMKAEPAAKDATKAPKEDAAEEKSEADKDVSQGKPAEDPQPEMKKEEKSEDTASDKTPADKPVAEVASAKRTTTSGTPAKKADPQDWLYWRGPEFNGVSRATGLPDSWDPEGGEGSNVIWKRDDLGTRSTPVVMNGKLFALATAEQGTPREGERVVCVDANTGETIWENRFNVYLSDVPVERVGWSAVTADPTNNCVYALGVSGHFQCIDADTGKTRWLRKMHEEFGMLTTYGGRTNFPVIYEDLVIISGIVIGWGEMAKPAHRFLGMDKNSGEVVWFTETTPLPFDTTYSSPTIKIVDGIPQYIIGAGDGKVWSMQPRTGQHNWSFALAARGLYGTPLVDGDTVYMAQGEENIIATEKDGKIDIAVDNTMGAVVAIDAKQRGDISVSGQKWKVLELNGNRSTPLMVNNRLYVIDDRAKLFVLDPETGEELFPKTPLGNKMFSSPLYADGKIYTITENGRYYVLGVKDDGDVEILTKGRLKEGDGIASPICAQGKLYFPTTAALYCVGDPKQETGFTGLPEQPKEVAVSEDQTPAHVQLIPAESLIRPSEEIQYRARLFNSKGQFLSEAKDVTYSAKGPASISKDGKFTGNGDAGHAAVEVVVEAGDLTGTGRVRIVPDLPWEFDFENIKIDEAAKKGEPPVTWVGARYRHVVREVNGNKVMVKITTIPKGTRSQSWMGHSDLHDYSIQADVMGHELSGQLPDIGVIAQGYEFILFGNDEKAKVLSWITQQRIAKEVPFTLEPEVWYHIKLKVSNKEKTAVAQAKVWKKGEPEPEQWMLEVEDSVPNTSGSPGLFGNAKTGEIYLDNIKVTYNND